MKKLWDITLFISCFFFSFCSPIHAFDFSKKQLPSYSQASQDKFVYILLYEILQKKDAGYYLEIGAGHPSFTNNSFWLEKNFGWKGVSIDIDKSYTQTWSKTRQNPLLVADATQCDYYTILNPFPCIIDYLSLDIDSGYDEVLQRIPFDKYTFKIITIEHDSYRLGDLCKQKERKILNALGYHLLCPDVSVFFEGRFVVFEDWWIHPSAFVPEVFSQLISLNLNEKTHDKIISAILNICKSN